ncbi:MAG: 30S ribosomal protein S16 [Patescibacteria group bacterium]
MLKIRLARIGKKKQPYYRLIISEQTRDTYGRVLEILGSYNPRSKQLELKTDKIKHWISLGAQASDTVHNLLVSNKIITAKKINISHLKASKKAEIAKKEQEKKEKTEPKPVEAAPVAAENTETATETTEEAAS